MVSDGILTVIVHCQTSRLFCASGRPVQPEESNTSANRAPQSTLHRRSLLRSCIEATSSVKFESVIP